MPITQPQSNQIVNPSAQAELGQAASATLDNLITSIDQSVRTPMRLFASATADANLNIAASSVQIGNGTARSVPPISSTVTPAFVASTINFQTGATTGGTINGSLPSTTVGQFRRVAFTLKSNNTVDMTFSAAVALQANLADAATLFTTGGQPVGWVDLVATAATSFKTIGSSTNIIENNPGAGTAMINNVFGGGGSSSSGVSAPASTATINDNQVASATLVTVAAPNGSGEFLYSIVRGTNRETGRILWSQNGTIISRVFFGDGGVGDTGTTLDIQLSGANVLLVYTSTSTGTAGTLTYSVISWA